ncbi:proteasome stabiliser-domain-containing protein [Phyllosticta citriasiana]|uniref:Proteasome stabiliser-domain-containing protein n=1 Tax=Phyllosticta citriasiana TaxID=595635 RepID=A0ABR1KUX4_9PEZI
MASTEARELELIGKVELRIALADSDAKLESLLNTYLSPLLLKLASEHPSVRQKVIAVCQHINTRVRPQEIKLPVAALLKQFKEHAEVPLIRHFDLLYIQRGLARQPLNDKLDLLPVLITGIAADTAKAAQHGSQLFNLLLRLLAHFRLPPRGSKDDDQLRERLGVSDEDAKFLAFWFGKLILFSVVRAGPSATGSSSTCPGVSSDEYQFLSLQGSPDVWDPSAEGGMNLAEAKVMASKFLASGLFTGEERFFPAVYASADSNPRISDIGDDMLKRTLPKTDLEDPQIIRQFYHVYFGSQSPGGPQPARPALRIKILSYLAKSVQATTFTDNVCRLVEEGLTFESGGDGAASSQAPAGARGREVFKLRSAIFTFVSFLARRGSPADLRVVGPTLVHRLKSFVEDQGWPKSNPGEDIALRGVVFEVIGLLAKAAPEQTILEPNLSLLRWLFRSLSEDNSGRDTAVSIDECLSSVLGALSSFNNAEIQGSLRELLLEQMGEDANKDDDQSKPRRSTRYAAVRFANRCLPYNDVVARWIDILAISGPSSEGQEVREEGNRGLDPHWSRLLYSSLDRPNDEFSFPDFERLSRYLLSLPTGSPSSARTRPRQQVLQFKQLYAHAYASSFSYLRRICLNEALRAQDYDLPVDADWARKLDIAVSTDMRARDAVKSYLIRATEEQGQILHSVLALMCSGFEGLIWEGGVGLGECGEKFVELCSLSHDDLLDMSGTAPAFRSLEPCILSNHEPTRTVAAHAYGILATHSAVTASDAEESLNFLLEKVALWRESVGSQVNQAAGALVAVAYYCSRLVARRRRGSASQEKLVTLSANLIDILKESTDKTLRESTYLALSQLALFYVIKPEKIPDFVVAKANYTSIVDEVMKSAKAGSERAILVLGHFSMVPDEKAGDPNLKYIEDQIFELHEVRQAEAQFAIGEAVSCLAASWDSAVLAPKMDIDASFPGGPSRLKTLPRILDQVLANCRKTKPALKKASVIWLLCLVEFCGHLSQVQTRLGDCQNAFKICLSDRDEVVQEAASRGLGLVYEKGDRSLKDDLVRDLVGSFSDNKPNFSGNVSDDTQLFEPGALPTGDGSVTTYKDILNLASEVGDPSLVYRFMSLASNNAIWSSRAAFGRFGLSTVLSDSSVDGYLAANPKLYPKLYRYRFDPNTNVQRSMKDIWDALVKDSNSTLNQHFDAIIQDLLQNILGREWRAREASCAAIADLIQGREIEKYEQYLGDIWTACFKVLDDIKDSVRKAAAGLARVLVGILTRSLESGDGSSKKANKLLAHVLPFLLSNSGIGSSVKEAQAFAMHTLLEIIKKSSAKILNQYVPELVERLISFLSDTEHESINMLHMKAKEYGLTEQQIDDARLGGIRKSPVMEAIESCIDHLDPESMEALKPRLESAIKTAMSLPSKVGASRVLVSLTTRRSFLFRPYADHFLKLLEKFIHDRNKTVSAAYAAAAGYLARLASDKALMSLIAFTKRMYFESDSERHRIEAGDVIIAFSKHASDKFTLFSTELLPFIFVAKHDTAAPVAEVFTRAWDDNVGGSMAVQLYVKNIVELAQKYLDSQQWALKHAAAKAIAAAADALASSLDDMTRANAEIVWPALVKAVDGKSWEGKEEVLNAFAHFVERSGQLWRPEQPIREEIGRIIVRESKRQNKTYRQYAFESLGRVSRARDDSERSWMVADIIEPVIDEYTGTKDRDEMDIDEGDELRKDEKVYVIPHTLPRRPPNTDHVYRRTKTCASAIFALIASIHPPHLPTSDELTPAILRALSNTARLNNLHSPSIHVAVFENLCLLFEICGTADVDKAALRDVLQKLLFDPRYEGLSEARRLKRAEAIVSAAKWLGDESAWVKEMVGRELAGGSERSGDVKAVLAKVLE